MSKRRMGSGSESDSRNNHNHCALEIERLPLYGGILSTTQVKLTACPVRTGNRRIREPYVRWCTRAVYFQRCS